MDLHADKIVLVRDGYTEDRVVIWETFKFPTPLFILSPIEATRLRDELAEAIERKLPKRASIARPKRKR